MDAKPRRPVLLVIGIATSLAVRRSRVINLAADSSFPVIRQELL
jgi:hypothetical protein